MAHKDIGNYHNFRLSKINAQHIKVDRILRDLNPEFVKSKNQYIADAIEYYTEDLDNDDMTLSGAIEKAKKAGYVTRGEFQGELENIEQRVKAGVIIEVQKEMLALLGTFTGNMATTLPIAVQQSVQNNKAEVELEEEINEKMTGLANKWA